MKEKNWKDETLEGCGPQSSSLPHFQLSGSLSSIRCFPLGNFPTPVQRLSNLERVLGFESLWVKRDDLSGPLGGGNKVRKLEYMFAAAHPDEGERKMLFTIGPTGSNHVRATAVYGKASGFRVECLLFKQPSTAYSEANYRTICEHAAAVQEVDRMTTMFVRYGYEQLKTAFGGWRRTLFYSSGWFVAARFCRLCESRLRTEITD